MDMAMAMGFDEHLDQVQVLAVAAMSPAGSSATSTMPAAAAAAPPAATAGAGSSDDDEATGAATDDDLRRGPWTVDEDILLVNYIAAHGDGRWNSLARSAGLRRTGKSCRLRWLNYLRPDVRRGNLTAGEQLLILELHARWGNRWSKIAQHLPGRTDNEVKNYWRTRVQKHAKQLRCDVNSAAFRHLVRHLWMPRLRERAAAQLAGCGGDDDLLQAPHQVVVAPLAAAIQAPPPATTTASAPPACYEHLLVQQRQGAHNYGVPAASEADDHQDYSEPAPAGGQGQIMAAAAATALSPDDGASSALRPSSSLTADDASHYYTAAYTANTSAANDQCCRATMADHDGVFAGTTTWTELLATSGGHGDDSSSMSMIGLPLPDWGFGDLQDDDGLWSLDNLCLQQLC